MILTLYRVLGICGWPLIRAFLWMRLRRGKEDSLRFPERRGIASRRRPKGRVVWLHGASVGEAISLLPVLERVQAMPGTTALLTTGTVTSARLMEKRLPEGALHQYLPVDHPLWVRRFLDHWNPDLALWSESEFWPNILAETKARGVPMVLLNGRISDRSFARWRRWPGLIGRILGCFVLCLGQTPEDAKRLKALGAAKVDCLGNLKFAAEDLPADATALASLTQAAEGRPRWLAASTHPGEEDIAARVHLALRAKYPGLLTLIVPRHPARGPEIAAALAAMGAKVALRSIDPGLAGDTEILIADTMGEVGLFYRLSPIVFMGKSLAGQGGQNPLEPARLSASVLFGPNMGNFTAMAREMLAAGAAEEVDSVETLAAAVARRLDDPAQVTENGVVARRFALAQAHVLEAVLDALRPWLATEAVDEGA